MTKQPSSKENLSEREVYIRPAKEANTDKIWRFQKCVYDLADASRYWSFKLKKSHLGLMQISVQLTHKSFQERKLCIRRYFICHVDDIDYGGTNKFESKIISKLKQTFQFGTEDAKAFTYIGIKLTQHADFTITVS